VAKVIIKLVLSRFIYSIPMFIKILVTYSSCKHKHDVVSNTSVQPNQKVKKAEKRTYFSTNIDSLRTSTQ